MEKLAEGFGLIEGPLWDDTRGLLFSDVRFGGVHCLKADGRVETVVPHRRGIGGIARHADGGLVISGRNVAWKAPSGATVSLLEADPAAGEVGFNDLTVDAQGRILVGSLAFRPAAGEHEARPGRLYRIGLDGRAEAVGEDVLLTNGLGFSPDGRRLYHSDSLRGHVRCHDVADDGTIGPWRPFADVPAGVPDGLAVATCGRVFVALARGGGGIAVFRPDGSLEGTVAAPQPMVTSLCFGGPGLSALYVVTGTEGGGEEREGCIYRLDAGAAGLPRPAARVRHATP